MSARKLVVIVVGVVSAVIVGLAWRAVAKNQAKLTEPRPPTRTMFVPSKPRGCDALTRSSYPTLLWVSNAAVRAAGWEVPLRVVDTQPNEVPLQVESTAGGTLVLAQTKEGTGAHDPENPGYVYWLARIEDGPLDTDHAPRAVVQRAKIAAFSARFYVIGGGFLMTSAAQQGVLEKLDRETLETVRRRTNVAPSSGMPAMNSFVSDGGGGLFFLSYGDNGARLHHIDANLDDVVPARSFTAPLEEREHWHPEGIAVDADRVCLKLTCRKELPSDATSADCGVRYVVANHRFEPEYHEVAPREHRDPHAAYVRWLAYAAGAVLLVALAYVLRWLAAWRALGRSPTEAEIVRVDATSITLRDVDDVTTIPRARLFVLFGGEVAPGPCVIPARATAPHGYRGAEPRAAGTNGASAIAVGTLPALRQRANRRLTRLLVAVCIFELAVAVAAGTVSRAAFERSLAQSAQ